MKRGSHISEIFPHWVFTGHGYHAHILLSEDVHQQDILKEFIEEFKQRGFPVDEACKDPARLMRLPMTYNCKAFAEGNNEEMENPVLCESLRYTQYRHSLQELRYKLGQIPISKPADAEIPAPKAAPKPNEGKKKIYMLSIRARYRAHRD